MRRRREYQVSFDMYENGVATGLVLDYGEFALSGKLADLKMLEASELPLTSMSSIKPHDGRDGARAGRTWRPSWLRCGQAPPVAQTAGGAGWCWRWTPP